MLKMQEKSIKIIYPSPSPATADPYLPSIGLHFRHTHRPAFWDYYCTPRGIITIILRLCVYSFDFFIIFALIMYLD